MEFRIERFNDSEEVRLLKLAGALNHGSYSELKKSLREEFEASNFLIILDCSEMTLISSLVVGSLFTTHQLLKSHRGCLVLSGCSEIVLETLRSLSLEDSFHLVEDVPSARDFLKTYLQ